MGAVGVGDLSTHGDFNGPVEWRNQEELCALANAAPELAWPENPEGVVATIQAGGQQLLTALDRFFDPALWTAQSRQARQARFGAWNLADHVVGPLTASNDNDDGLFVETEFLQTNQSCWGTVKKYGLQDQDQESYTFQADAFRELLVPVLLDPFIAQSDVSLFMFGEPLSNIFFQPPQEFRNLSTSFTAAEHQTLEDRLRKRFWMFFQFNAYEAKTLRKSTTRLLVLPSQSQHVLIDNLREGMRLNMFKEILRKNGVQLENSPLYYCIEDFRCARVKQARRNEYYALTDDASLTRLFIQVDAIAAQALKVLPADKSEKQYLPRVWMGHLTDGELSTLYRPPINDYELSSQIGNHFWLSIFDRQSGIIYEHDTLSPTDNPPKRILRSNISRIINDYDLVQGIPDEIASNIRPQIPVGGVDRQPNSTCCGYMTFGKALQFTARRINNPEEADPANRQLYSRTARNIVSLIRSLREVACVSTRWRHTRAACVRN